MPETILCIGTRKGLLLARSSDRINWTIDGPHFEGDMVYSAGIDTRGERPRLLVGADSPHWGPSVFHSDDLGGSWKESGEGAVRFPKDSGDSVERVWQLRPAGAEHPGVVYAGAEPSSLWRSVDGGETYSLVQGLWDHPHRPNWHPGFGGQCLHTVVPDPSDADTVLVAMSTGGVYRTTDGGKSWNPSNTGVKAEFLPEGQQYPEYGQCVHKVSPAAASAPGRMYMQNHGGVYRSDDNGGSWTSIAEGLPSDFGFSIVAHPHRADVAYTFPIDSSGARVPAGHRLRVFRTEDAGRTWQPLANGLPGEDHYGTVLRDGMCADDNDPAGIYFGNRNGEVYASPDEGDSWVTVATHLADILTVKAARIG